MAASNTQTRLCKALKAWLSIARGEGRPSDNEIGALAVETLPELGQGMETQAAVEHLHGGCHPEAASVDDAFRPRTPSAVEDSEDDPALDFHRPLSASVSTSSRGNKKLPNGQRPEEEMEDSQGDPAIDSPKPFSPGKKKRLKGRQPEDSEDNPAIDSPRPHSPSKKKRPKGRRLEDGHEPFDSLSDGPHLASEHQGQAAQYRWPGRRDVQVKCLEELWLC